MANSRAIDNQRKRMTRANGEALSRRCRWIGIALVVLLAGCAANRAHNDAISATSRPIDITCPHCTMKHYVWDSRGRRSGKVTHHDIWNMECPDCVVRMSGIWTIIGRSHMCCDCPAGVERCPMCRAADRDDGKYPTSQPDSVQAGMPATSP